MIVVADTTPLNYLVLIEEVDLLPTLYDTVLIPPAVHQEMLQAATPESVRKWASGMPAWCEVRPVSPSTTSNFRLLDLGEREAIQLALESGVQLLLMDDGIGRREAERLHLEVRGTLAILEAAAQRGLIDFRSTLAKLEQTTFRLSDKIREEFLRRNP